MLSPEAQTMSLSLSGSFSLPSLPSVSASLCLLAGGRLSLCGRKIFSGNPRHVFFQLVRVTDFDWLCLSHMVYSDPITVHQGTWYCDWPPLSHGSHAHWPGNDWYSQQGLVEWGMSSSKESEESKWESLLGKQKLATAGYYNFL